MTVGILGGGQLARMLGLAGIPLGLRFVVYDPAAHVGGAAIGQHIRAGYEDLDALREFADQVDIVTYEFENVSVAAVEFLQRHRPVYPDHRALHATQDRLREKEFFRMLDIPTADFLKVDAIDDARAAAADFGYPLVLKSRSGGYDGKGQVVIRSAAEVEARWNETAKKHLIAEAFVPFDREVSMIAARGASGETAFYDVAENTHADGILRTTYNRPEDPAAEAARGYVARLLDELGYVGVIALECFDVGGRLLANEYAPRVHNSGHWTIEGAACSQFENHLRAILGWPLGSTRSIGLSVMLNCIGAMPAAQQCAAVADTHFHSYDKSPRPGRKVGHVTVRAADAASRDERAKRIRELIDAAG